jgi:putative Holliday junction resolvase
MARIMAFDYGRKRTGIAVSDPEQIIATGLDTVETKNLEAFVKNYVSKEMVESFVVGVPINLGYAENDVMKDIRLFIGKMRALFPDKPVHEVDETLTSAIATQTIRASGVNRKKRRDKAAVDKVSATLILQSFMAMR